MKTSWNSILKSELVTLLLARTSTLSTASTRGSHCTAFRSNSLNRVFFDWVACASIARGFPGWISIKSKLGRPSAIHYTWRMLLRVGWAWVRTSPSSSAALMLTTESWTSKKLIVWVTLSSQTKPVTNLSQAKFQQGESMGSYKISSNLWFRSWCKQRAYTRWRSTIRTPRCHKKEWSTSFGTGSELKIPAATNLSRQQWKRLNWIK